MAGLRGCAAALGRQGQLPEQVFADDGSRSGDLGAVRETGNPCIVREGRRTGMGIATADLAEHMRLPPIAFAMSTIARSGRVDLDRLARVSPGFVAGYRRAILA
jgi:hypothetical protein